MLLGQQALNFALGDRQANGLQQGGQTRQCGWPWWYCINTKRRRSGPKCPSISSGSGAMMVWPSGVTPALAAVADRMHRHHEFLHQVGLVALEARSGRAVAFNTRSSTLTRGLTLPRRGLFPGRVGPAGVVAFSMPLGLISGRPFNPFSRAISSRCCATVCLSSATSPNSRTTSSFG
jgi:hypothetical protein